MNEDQHSRAAGPGSTEHDALAELVPLYALDALDPDEAQAVHAHLATCAQCRAELDSLRGTVADLAEVTAVEPPSSLRARVLAAAEQVEQEPGPEVSSSTASTEPEAPPEDASGDRPQTAGDAGSHSDRHLVHRRTLVAGGLALAASAVIGTGLAVTRPWLSPEQKQIRQIQNASDARTYTTSADGAEVRVIRAPSEHAAVVEVEGMDPAPAGHDYQLWYLEDSRDPVSAGVLHLDDEGAATALLDGSVPKATGVAMTVEPEGGSEQPTTDPTVAVTFS